MGACCAIRCAPALQVQRGAGGEARKPVNTSG